MYCYITLDTTKVLDNEWECKNVDEECGLLKSEVKAEIPIKLADPVTDDTVDYLSSELLSGDSHAAQVWDKTVLGKAYQEERKSKRERKQPYDLNSISTGISLDKQTRSYRYLETKPIHKVNLLEKPEFVVHPEKFFLKKKDSVEENIPQAIDNLKLRHDEKTIFPKHVIDKMKHTGRSALSRPSVFVRLSVMNRAMLSKSKDGWANVLRETLNSTTIQEE